VLKVKQSLQFELKIFLILSNFTVYHTFYHYCLIYIVDHHCIRV